MSLIRKIANGIADLVVRYASPGSKEWAEAMQAELVSKIGRASCRERVW